MAGILAATVDARGDRRARGRHDSAELEVEAGGMRVRVVRVTPRRRPTFRGATRRPRSTQPAQAVAARRRRATITERRPWWNLLSSGEPRCSALRQRGRHHQGGQTLASSRP